MTSTTILSRGRWTALAWLTVAGCNAPSEPAPTDLSSTDPAPRAIPNLSCEATESDLFAGGPGRDGIPSLQNPELVPADDAAASYLDAYTQNRGEQFWPSARIIGLDLEGSAVAIPHNILWYHEIVNVDVGGRRLSITYCPLTGSALAFDATEAGTERFGVSGIIFQNNLVMFDPETGSLWPQMCGRSVLGDRAGDTLTQHPIIDMRWETWKERHPNTLVVGENTGHDRRYDEYPYSTYEVNDFLLFPLPRPLDPDIPMKERVFGIPSVDGGMAFPFSELDQTGALAVTTTRLDDQDYTVLWDRQAETAAAYLPITDDGATVTLFVDRDRIVDSETGSEWDVEGRATTGALSGSRLVAHPDSYVVYWFAWSSFYPKTRVWRSD